MNKVRGLIDDLCHQFFDAANRYTREKDNYYLGMAHAYFIAICGLAREHYGISDKYYQLQDELYAVIKEEV